LVKRENIMKKITILAITSLALLIAGCTREATGTDQNKEQDTEQVTKEDKTDQSSSNKSDTKFEAAPDHLTGKEDYSAIIAYELQKSIGHKNAKVYYYKDVLSVALTVSKSDMDEADMKDLSNDVFDIKRNVVNQYNSDHKSYKRMKLRVYDDEIKLISYELNNSMVLDK